MVRIPFTDKEINTNPGEDSIKELGKGLIVLGSVIFITRKIITGLFNRTNR